jgi:hypothetical protein
MFPGCGGKGTVSWIFVRQATVSRSPTATEYVAAGELAKELQNMHQAAPIWVCKYALFLLALKSLLRSIYSLTLFLQQVQRMSTISLITCEAREDATNRLLCHFFSGQLRGKFYQAAGKCCYPRGSRLAWHVSKGSH